MLFGAAGSPTGGHVAPSRCDQHLYEQHMGQAPGHQTFTSVDVELRRENVFCGLCGRQSSVKIIQCRVTNKKTEKKLVMFIWKIP